MGRNYVIVVCLLNALMLVACGSEAEPEPEEEPPVEYNLEGTWISDADVTAVRIDGDTGRLVRFPAGPAFGLEHFDVGDAYFRGIEKIGPNLYEAEHVVFDDDAQEDGLNIEGVSYTPCTIEQKGTASFVVSREVGSRTVFVRATTEVRKWVSGACEGRFPGPQTTYKCAEGHPSDRCDPVAFGLSTVDSLDQSYEFEANRTCAELGYAYQYETPARYQYSEDDDTTPGPSGNWGGEVGSIGSDPDGGEGGSSGSGGAGGTGGSGTTSDVRYLIYGTVWAPASDCNEGSFEDANWYYYRIISGEYSETYQAEHDALEAQMMSEHPGGSGYYVKSSWFEYGREATNAVVIGYTQTLQAWDCRPYIIAIGFGKSYDEALANALEVKSGDNSGSAPYTELENLTW